MFAAKFNYCVERVTIVGLCLWGNWAIYYWVAVLAFDASYISLKSYMPVFLLQIVASLFYLLRTDLGFPNASHLSCTVEKPYSMYLSGRRFLALSAIATLFAVGAVLVADHFHWTRSALSYNLFWALLLPCSLAYLFYLKVSNGNSPASAPEADYRSDIRDCLLFFLTVIALAIAAYGSGFPSWDDAFYGHVMSSTLANPTLPVQGQDLLLNTSAPYSLHPSYRGVGYEVLIAMVSEVVGQRPLQLYLAVFPVFGVVFWSFASYLFMRTMSVPYPGLAMTVSLVAILNWGGSFPTQALLMLWSGKSLVFLIAAPLSFFVVAAFMRMPTLRTWFLLLFSVCSLAIWSSTALFVVPISVGLAGLVFLPSIRKGLPVLLAAFCTLIPILLLFVYSLLVLQGAPVNTEGVIETGFLWLNGHEYGGLYFKGIFLIILIVLPLLARTVDDARFQTNILRVCLVGILTVMAPFLIEAITRLTGLNLLAVRLPSAYPGTLLLGVIASIAAVNLSMSAVWSKARRIGYQLVFLVLMVSCAAYGVKQIAFSEERAFARAILEAMYDETLAARKLIGENAVVASGDFYFLLPALPEPPVFVSVRHYLNYHKYSLSEADYLERKYLQTTLENRLPESSENLETTINSIISILAKLGVTAVVFEAEVGNSVFKPNSQKVEFVTALVSRLTKVGYDCATTSSGITIVCNR